jgi:hypothetical protein
MSASLDAANSTSASISVVAEDGDGAPDVPTSGLGRRLLHVGSRAATAVAVAAGRKAPSATYSKLSGAAKVAGAPAGSFSGSAHLPRWPLEAASVVNVTTPATSAAAAAAAIHSRTTTRPLMRSGESGVLASNRDTTVTATSSSSSSLLPSTTSSTIQNSGTNHIVSHTISPVNIPLPENVFDLFDNEGDGAQPTQPAVPLPPPPPPPPPPPLPHLLLPSPTTTTLITTTTTVAAATLPLPISMSAPLPPPPPPPPPPPVVVVVASVTPAIVVPVPPPSRSLLSRARSFGPALLSSRNRWTGSTSSKGLQLGDDDDDDDPEGDEDEEVEKLDERAPVRVGTPTARSTTSKSTPSIVTVNTILNAPTTTAALTVLSILTATVVTATAATIPTSTPTPTTTVVNTDTETERQTDILGSLHSATTSTTSEFLVAARPVSKSAPKQHTAAVGGFTTAIKPSLATSLTRGGGVGGGGGGGRSEEISAPSQGSISHDMTTREATTREELAEVLGFGTFTATLPTTLPTTSLSLPVFSPLPPPPPPPDAPRSCADTLEGALGAFLRSLGIATPFPAPALVSRRAASHSDRSARVALCQRLDNVAASYLKLTAERRAAVAARRAAWAVSIAEPERNHHATVTWAAARPPEPPPPPPFKPELPPRAAAPREAVWTMRFSRCGAWLAVAGGAAGGSVVRLFRVAPWEGSNDTSDTTSAAAAHTTTASNNNNSSNNHNNNNNNISGRLSTYTSEDENSSASVSHPTTAHGGGGGRGGGVTSIDGDSFESPPSRGGGVGDGVLSGGMMLSGGSVWGGGGGGGGSQGSGSGAWGASGEHVSGGSEGEDGPSFSGSIGASASGSIGGISGGGGTRMDLFTLGAPFLESTPVREWLGHDDVIVDLSWSRAALLLSASMDGTVRLWHPSRPECLHRFAHPDAVTSVAFHPIDGTASFVTGCFDRRLRVWSLETGRVIVWQAAPSIITAVAVSQDGRTVAAGLFSGAVAFFATEGLHFIREVKCATRKVTGLEFVDLALLLVTTNDSRVRLVAYETGTVNETFTGGANDSLQIRAAPDSEANRFIIGSDDSRVCVWRRGSKEIDFFHANEGAQDAGVAEVLNSGGVTAGPSTVTVAIFAPKNALAIARPVAAAHRWRADALDSLDELANAVERAARAASGAGVLNSALPPPPTISPRLDPTQLASAAERLLRYVASAARAAAAIAAETRNAKEVDNGGGVGVGGVGDANVSGDDASISDSASRGSASDSVGGAGRGGGGGGGGGRRMSGGQRRSSLSTLEAALARAADAFEGAASDNIAVTYGNGSVVGGILGVEDPEVRAAGEALALSIAAAGSAGPHSAIRAGAEWSVTRARAKRLLLPLAARYGSRASVPLPRAALDGHCVIVTGDAAGVLRIYEITDARVN